MPKILMIFRAVFEGIFRVINLSVFLTRAKRTLFEKNDFEK